MYVDEYNDLAAAKRKMINSKYNPNNLILDEHDRGIKDFNSKQIIN